VNAWLPILLAAQPWLGAAPLVLVPGESRQVVFADEAQSIEVRFRNSTATNVEVPLRFRVFQASSATVLPIGEPHSWKTLPVLAGQTVVESFAVRFPAVRVDTRFLVQWLDEHEQALGTTEVVAVPPNLLCELKSLAGETPLGVFDPQDQLRPLLRRVGVEFEDLDPDDIERFRGRLAVVCATDAKEEEPPALSRGLKKCREAGVNILWFRRTVPGMTSPATVCLVRPGAGTLVVADSQALSGLADSPARQRTLISLARLTVKAEQFELTQP